MKEKKNIGLTFDIINIRTTLTSCISNGFIHSIFGITKCAVHISTMHWLLNATIQLCEPKNSCGNIHFHLAVYILRYGCVWLSCWSTDWPNVGINLWWRPIHVIYGTSWSISPISMWFRRSMWTTESNSIYSIYTFRTFLLLWNRLGSMPILGIVRKLFLAQVLIKTNGRRTCRAKHEYKG